MQKHAYDDHEIPVKPQLLKRIWFLSFHLPIPSLYNKERDLIYPLDAFNWTPTNYIMCHPNISQKQNCWESR